jgi:hypothetical protein
MAKNRTPAETWQLRALQNAVNVDGKIYTWKPTKPMQHWNGRNSEKVFTQCVFALICANVVFIAFLFWFVGQIR